MVSQHNLVKCAGDAIVLRLSFCNSMAYVTVISPSVAFCIDIRLYL